MRANEAQLDAWNGDSGTRWVADADRRDAVLAPVADALLDAAAMAAGERALDIGCGCGITTIAAARTAAHAVGVDLSAPMLALARQRAAGASATFLEADAQTHRFEPEAFDVAISRFGTMFFDDPNAAFTNMAAAVRRGGRLRLATWQRLEANDWLTIPGAALLRYGTLPDTPGDEPGMFAQADPEVVRSILCAAGWRDVEVEARSVQLRLGADAADATDYLADTGIARRVLETIAPADRPHALAAVTEALEPFATETGVHLAAGINLIRANR